MEENKKEETTKKLDIKKKRKSMLTKRNLIDFEEYNDNKKTKESIPLKRTSTKKNSEKGNSISNLQLIDQPEVKEEEKENKGNLDNVIKKPIKHKARKSVVLSSMLSLNKFVSLKGQLTNISELVIQQEADISEIICGCQQPNNYHIYLRERNGQLSYIYKLREFSGQCNRIFCPVNCREFTMKMKLMSDSSNKYDTDFNDSLVTMQRNFKVPCLCLIRPELEITLTKEKIKVGRIQQSFTFCDPVFKVFNETDEEVYYIEADCCQCGFFCRNYSIGKTDDCQFLIYNSNDKTKPIGYIMKKTESVYSLSDSYLVVFPSQILPEDKFLLANVAVLIDYHYYEQNNDVIK